MTVDSVSLSQKVTAAWVATYLCDPDPTLNELAEAALAALGLDDLDAAVERADAANWAKDLYEHTGEESKAAMRDALIAALTVAT